jgi:hypothetical protein
MFRSGVAITSLLGILLIRSSGLATEAQTIVIQDVSIRWTTTAIASLAEIGVIRAIATP